jgi:hypothetical protein
MDDERGTDRSIDSLLSESGFGDDAMLKAVLVRARKHAIAVRPLPAPAVARLMSTRPRRRPRHDRRFVVAVIVGATVLGGGAAAASPLLGVPDVAATVIAGLFGAGPDAPHPAPSPSTGVRSQHGDPGQVPHSPIGAEQGESSSHPTPQPGQPKGSALPEPAQTHLPTPVPDPTPRSTHAIDHPQP